MAKRSRTRLSSQAADGSSPTSSGRAARRRPVRRAHEKTFVERYGSWLLVGLVAAGAVLILFVAFNSATQAAYACTAELTPGPTEPNPTPRPSPTASPTPSPSQSAAPSSTATGPSPSVSPPATASASASASPSAAPSITPVPTPVPQPTARLGFTTTDLGRTHVANGTASIKYAFCPPTSGDHYNNTNAPMKAAVYPPGQEDLPGNWIHNLEHGYVVLAYRCPSGVLGQGDCISQSEFNQLTDWFNQAPEPTRSQCATKVIVVRFDSMNTRFALLAWDRAMLTDAFDLPSGLTFVQQWMEYESVPEAQSC